MLIRLSDSARLFHADCRDAIKSLPDNSIDSCVTDPPYALVSMVKRFGKASLQDATQTSERSRAGADGMARMARGFMGCTWDTGEVAFSEEFWAEVLRVLKPGGHVAAFGASRGYHRMACAIEDAGFEIRDSLMWVYGTGFPKSHDVSKGIDKAGGNPLAWQAFAKAYAAAVSSSQYNHADIDRVLGIKASSCYWVRTDHRGGMPPRHHWQKVRELLNLSSEFERLYDEAEREVVGQKTSGIANKEEGTRHTIGASSSVVVDITAPATDAARQWEGWGTALKPSHEPITVATKPLTVQQHFAILLDYLTDLLEEQTIWFGLNAHVAEKNFSAIRVKLDAVTKPFVLDSAKMRVLANFDPARFADHSSIFQEHGFCVATKTQDDFVQSHARQSSSAASYLALTTPHGPADDLSIQLAAMCMSVVTDGISENIVSSWASISDAILNRANTFTIETASRLTIVLRTWNSLTSPNTIDGTGSLFPNVSPIVLARKPLSGGTVAENVLRWGTGALNIGACRVEATDSQLAEKYASVRNAPPRENAIYGSDTRARSEGRIEPHSAGRWPANVVHDGSDEVVGAFPRAKGAVSNGSKTQEGHCGTDTFKIHAREQKPGYADDGSAARFFYSAKASRADRAGSKHPTVKPIALMQWLARLITPPGGTVLDPFAGSGTTGAACEREGFSVILCEREDEYVRDIQGRFSTRPDPLARLLRWNAAVASYKSKVAA